MPQVSIDQLPEDEQDSAMHATEQASQDYPSTCVEGHLVHVCQIHGGWEVWVNCEDADFTGLCVSIGSTRDEAVVEAVKVLEAIVEHLQRPA